MNLQSQSTLLSPNLNGLRIAKVKIFIFLLPLKEIEYNQS